MVERTCSGGDRQRRRRPQEVLLNGTGDGGRCTGSADRVRGRGAGRELRRLEAQWCWRGVMRAEHNQGERAMVEEEPAWEGVLPRKGSWLGVLGREGEMERLSLSVERWRLLAGLLSRRLIDGERHGMGRGRGCWRLREG